MVSEAFLARLDAMKLFMRSPAHGGSGGLRHSHALGSSVEFSDFREYASGDDLRRVDWNAYARFDKLFLKLFMEEQETKVNILLDASASMSACDEKKWDMALSLCQIVAYLSLRGGDRVTVYALSDTVTHTASLSGRAGYMKITEFLKSVRPQGKNLLSASVTRLPLGDARGITVVISDLLSEDGYEKALSSLLFRKQETTVLQVLSKEEICPQLEGTLEIIDSETGEKMQIEANRDTMEHYEKEAREFLSGVNAFCRARMIGQTLLTSDADMEKTVLREIARAGLIA